MLIMGEIIDEANALTELQLSVALSNRKQEPVLRNGFCNYCGSPVPVDHAFCDSDCHDDYEYELKRAKCR